MQGDRKKTMILGILFLVIVAVGAFQLRPSAPPPAAKSKPVIDLKIAEQAKDATPAPNPDLPPFAERDPFDIPADSVAATKVVPQATAQQASPIVVQPKSLGGMIPPMSITGARLTKETGSTTGASALGNAAAKPEPTMNWHLAGVVSGAHSLAVLADATGNQRLIRVGSAIDPDSHLVSVGKGSATILFRGKTLRLLITGDPNAK
jgi:hypothetical protein